MIDFFPSKIKVVNENHISTKNSKVSIFNPREEVSAINISPINDYDNVYNNDRLDINKIEDLTEKISEEGNNTRLLRSELISEKIEENKSNEKPLESKFECKHEEMVENINEIIVDEKINTDDNVIKKPKRKKNKVNSSNDLISISNTLLGSFVIKKEENALIKNNISNNNFNEIRDSNALFTSKLGSVHDIEKRRNLGNNSLNDIGAVSTRERIFLSVDEVKNKIDLQNRKKQQSTLDLFNFKVPDRNFNKNKSMKELANDTLIKICSWNVNGLRRIIENETLNEFIKRESPDFLCLNETKVDQDALLKEKYFQIQSEAYGSYWNCSKMRKGYSGVAIFTRFSPLSVTYGLGCEEHDQEGRIITLEYPSFFLISAYIPNSGPELKRLEYRIKHWDIAFYDFVFKLSLKKNVILAGDLNVLHKDPDLLNGKRYTPFAGGTIEERENFDRFLQKGFFDTFLFCNQEKSRFGFDYFIIDEKAKSKVIESDILVEYEGSDHYPIKLVYHNNE